MSQNGFSDINYEIVKNLRVTVELFKKICTKNRLKLFLYVVWHASHSIA